MVALSGNPNAAVVELTPKPVRDRFSSGAGEIATESRAGENHEDDRSYGQTRLPASAKSRK
jgi:hypothetical protein